MTTKGGGEDMSILDPKFKYISAASTDIRKTFAKMRKAIAKQQRQEKEALIERDKKVRVLK